MRNGNNAGERTERARAISKPTNATNGADQAKIAMFNKNAFAIFGKLRTKISAEKKLC